MLGQESLRIEREGQDCIDNGHCLRGRLKRDLSLLDHSLLKGGYRGSARYGRGIAQVTSRV